jgi:hypothetical protein
MNPAPMLNHHIKSGTVPVARDDLRQVYKNKAK